MLEILKFAAAVVGTHYVACFIQTVLHARLGHDRVGGEIFRTHVCDHHAIYSDVFTAHEYLDEEKSLTALYLVPIAICTGLAFWLFPLALACTVLGTFIASLWLHAFIHVQYHLEDSFCNHFRWFRKRQRLHKIHHEMPNRNFGVLEFVWDRVLGTYSDDAAVQCEVRR